ncbi:uncharacterized protein N7458_004022 [Penicillium daleae]|uniref:BTB domain-containing protein n=1 Tax=Penicillium daleae TaxID=63821 RepID=A0AAD6C9M8_9EURO|nr:uncharacterized protein N7458_004022 [Penicillium daleae]KAJ5455758.1 hypothetical protein N7458_004022 [Penicillium daleae]
MEPRDYSRCVPHSPISIPKPCQPPQPLQAVHAIPSSALKPRTFADQVEHLPTNSIIHSPSFTFLVGPKHTKLTIQSGLAQHVSKPLHNLMNNGHTRESKHRIAVLEDEDVETFVAFCEYAYTGDYKVPQLPMPVQVPTPTPPQREDLRTGVVESAPSTGPSWRGTYRSDSVSSVPPPAPSPPPESQTDSQTDSQTVKAEEQVPSIVEEDVSAEVDADAETGEEELETQAQKGIEEAEPSPWTDETVEPSEPLVQPRETDWAQSQNPENALAESDGQPAPEAVEPADEPSWEANSPDPAYKKKSKKMKVKKGKKKSQLQPLEEEPPASLTPPSTPSPQEPQVVEVQPDPEPEPEPEEPEAVEEETPAYEGGLQEPEPEPEDALVEEPTESSLPSPMPSPSAAPTEAPEWFQSINYPPQEEQDNIEDIRTPEPKSSISPRASSPTESSTIQAPSSPKPIIDMSFAKQQSDSPRTPGLSLWDEFAALQYNDDCTVPITPKPSTTSTSATATELPYLTFHAKVYVFATRYLIPALAQLCLRKLHTDLLHLPLHDETYTSAEDNTEDRNANPETDTHPPTKQNLPGAPAIVLDVLHYAYTKTTRLEPINPTSATQLRENELRRLVVHYAACRVKELARWHGGGSGRATPADGAKPDSLRALLDGTPELASDLVYRMM